ncbi:plexin-2-like [Ruditapes philippinarum]|uniref:plexin-2-like n=1 Tax=Ruditapes philippinarum TaxID=129788 RepID=UPI00295A7519|nr:plexin-2-like [Ruditapes philippinarum]
MFTKAFRAFAVNDSVFCIINAPHLLNKPLQNESTEIYYGSSGKATFKLEDQYKHYVTVYNCTMLATDCTQCKALNKTRFLCDWCTNTNRCGYKDQNCSSVKCPAPSITDVIPMDGPVDGGTIVTIYGLNLGSSLLDINSVEIANIPCKINYDMSQTNDTPNGIFESKIPNRIICLTGSSKNETSGPVILSVNSRMSSSTVTFYYRVPIVTDILPHYGPEAGGTHLTIFGKNLGIGNRNVNVKLGNFPCLRPEVRPEVPLENMASINSTIVCTVGKRGNNTASKKTVYVGMDRRILIIPDSFTYVHDPTLQPSVPKKAFLSGGTKITIEGTHLDNANSARLTISFMQDIETGDCIILSENLASCETPKAPKTLEEELFKFENSTDRFLKHVTVVCSIFLDNVEGNIEIKYYQDPIINQLAESDHVVKFEADERLLNITGNMLNLVATKCDIIVTVGVELCVVVELNLTCITCIAPIIEPRSRIPNATRPEVNVTIGNIHKMIGYVEYIKKSPDTIRNYSSTPITSVVLSATGAGAALIFISATAVVLICRQYRKTKSKLRNIVKQNSTKEEIPCELRLSRIAGSSCEMNYSEVYNDQYESDHYDTIASDNIQMDRCETNDNSLNCPRESVLEARTSTSEQSQTTNHITVEVQLEEAIATNVKSEPELAGDQLYLHVINISDLSD